MEINMKICIKCNINKSSKYPHIWLEEKGYLEEYDKKSTEKYLKLTRKGV